MSDDLFPSAALSGPLPAGTPDKGYEATGDDLFPAAAFTQTTLPPSEQLAPAPASAGSQFKQAAEINPFNLFGQIAGHSLSSMAGSAVSGVLAYPTVQKGIWQGMYDIASGKGVEQAQNDIYSSIDKASQQIESTSGKLQTPESPLAQQLEQSKWNPLNWPGMAFKKAGETAQEHGASPLLATAVEVVPQAALMIAGSGKGAPESSPKWGKAPASVEGGSVGAPAADGGAMLQGEPEPLGRPVAGGLPNSAHDMRAQVLARVGLPEARESAITGDANSAAVDYQMTKFDEPAGRIADQQFQQERNALANHVERMIGETGGTIGMDEDQIANRGATIAQPFDNLRDWFKQRINQLYQDADSRAGGAPITNLQSIDALLNDPTFKNSLMAKNQQGLLNAVSNQLDHFRQANPNGFNVQTAEQVRQWMNQIWSPDNKWAVRQLKDAIDNDVTSAAGDDVYQQARAIRQLRSKVLEDPKGIAQLFDADPNMPINRATPIEKIPDRLAQLPIEQFQNIVKTLKDMPDEVQPDAQAALGEIKAHFLNKMLQAGVQTSRGVGAQVWGSDRVANVMRSNAAKLRVLFQDDPEIQQGIKDLHDAGQILRVDQSYPGAAAQAANALKRGLMSKALPPVGAMLGGGAAGMVGGPLASAVGAGVGEQSAVGLAGKISEKAAVKAWQKRIVKTEKANK